MTRIGLGDPVFSSCDSLGTNPAQLGKEEPRLGAPARPLPRWPSPSGKARTPSWNWQGLRGWDGLLIHAGTPSPSGDHTLAHVHQLLPRTCFLAPGTHRDMGDSGQKPSLTWCFTHSWSLVKIC